MTDGWLYSAWTVVLAGAIATYMWRGVGVALSGRLNPDGPVLRWIGAVAFASLAALIGRMILLPVGALQTTPTLDRVAAAVLAVIVFALSRRSLILGVGAGGGALVLFSLARL
jgi:branched-subunit amino acid transport protein